ncbi:transcription termination factor NusA [bacterium]|nr:transcription termination factor NusA [bacterium]
MKIELYNILSQIESEKGIKKQSLVGTIEDALMSAYKKDYGVNANVKVSVNISTEEIKILIKKKVVEEVKSSSLEISIEEAKRINSQIKIGEEIEIENEIKDFGRIAAQTAKQVITQRIREAEKEIIYTKFREKIGDVITGSVQTIAKGNIYVNLGNIEGILSSKEQIPTEEYGIGDRIKSYISDVKMGFKGTYVTLSRTHPNLIKKLFELEIPEIYEKIVEIKSIARDPGFRSKIAVVSNDSSIDPVGTCVGVRGTRINTIIQELNEEKIDVILYNSDPVVFIKNALGPVKVTSVTINKEEKQAKVIIPNNQLSLAIGKNGRNVKLAAKLTGWRIDIQGEEKLKEELKEETTKKLEAMTAGTKIEKVEETVEEIPLDLPGVSKVIVQRLIEVGYKDGESILKASVEELTKLKGVGKNIAEVIKVSAKSISK